EWWTQDLAKALETAPDAAERLEAAGVSAGRTNAFASSQASPGPTEAVQVSRVLGMPLHPAYTPRFDRLSVSDIMQLRESCRKTNDGVEVDIASPHLQWILQSALVEHRIVGSRAVVTGDAAVVLSELLALGLDRQVPPGVSDVTEFVRQLSGIRLGRQTTSTVGVRVGRPEKAMVRRLKPPVHVLFPVGNEGGASRDVLSAARAGSISVEVVNFVCPSCNERRLTDRCEVCGEQTQRFRTCSRCGLATTEPECPKCRGKTNAYSSFDLNLKAKLDSIRPKLPYDHTKPVKGVRGLTSETKTPEPLEKGIIRSKHGVYVYKDGTLRIDATNAPLTHFRPSDIGADMEKLVSLGYETDRHGQPLTDPNQVLELKPQDIIVPRDIAEDLLRMAQFIDDELQSLYGLSPFYNAQSAEDMLGRIVIGLAPHTSVGVVGRVVGFSSSQVCFGNPCWQAAKRRDCDGDGDSLLLLPDALLNFSIEFIPNQIGGLMDTPLLIQPVLIPSEVDEQAHNFDLTDRYPLEFYEETQGSPAASALSGKIEMIGSRLSNENQFYGYGFTHDTRSLTIKRSRGAYSTLKTLNEKISKQIEVASKVEAVSTKEVVESIIRTHLIRDIMGNAKKYASQSFKCKKCGATIRRPPLSWTCPYCAGPIKGTLTRASVEKYLAIAQRLAKEYDIDPYLRSRLDVLQRELDQLFQGQRKPEQLELTDFATQTLAEEISR
ncbi:MAG TPA: DNA polymerase II large subunit, partial [Nitrososphaerales archaeon]|nr:DNA polymerase II large subunit [Nitrososphaerales archaeon]